MELPRSSRDSLSPTCSLTIFDCLSPQQHHERSPNISTGYEREMKVMYQQPHLVPPMKLTVWDQLPPTPPPSAPSQISQWGRSLASRASGRASVSVRRKPNHRPVISGPQPIDNDDLPFRRRKYQPLQLSIYMNDNRLSDLPEFDRLSFTPIGEIKFPPRALIRTKSEEFIITSPVTDVPRKPASMFEQKGVSHVRHETVSSVISTSRPPSEYDALHSHPVSWASLPGLPPQVHVASRHEASVKILSPMQEEFTPPATSVVIDGMVLDFLNIEASNQVAHTSIEPDCEAPAPSPKVPSALQPMPPLDVEQDSGPTYFHTNYHTQRRISQWLANRSHSASISTVKTSSTSSSFAEHRRKRSQFYQLSASQPPPQPLQLAKPYSHQRTMTASTVASTVDTDVLSFEFNYANPSETSMTTAPDLLSRSGTVKSGVGVNPAGFINSVGLKPIYSGVPDLPPCYGEVIGIEKDDNMVLIEEIGDSLRSPGVGMAF